MVINIVINTAIKARKRRVQLFSNAVALVLHSLKYKYQPKVSRSLRNSLRGSFVIHDSFLGNKNIFNEKDKIYFNTETDIFFNFIEDIECGIYV